MSDSPQQLENDDFRAVSGGLPPRQPLPVATTNELRPLRWREIFSLLVLVVLCDITMYRGQGLAGYALLFVAAPILLLLGSPRPHAGLRLWVVLAMLAAISAKTIWCGSGLQLAAGFALLVAFSMALAGLCPHVLGMGVFASQAVLAGYAGLIHYWRALSRRGPPVTRVPWMSIVLPLVTLLIFSTIFVLANPELLTAFGEQFSEWVIAVREWITDAAPRPTEVIFWGAVLWIAVGLLRPVVSRALFEESADTVDRQGDSAEETVESPLYVAYRNTLLTVIVLFAVYLGFEFKTLWFRVFPEGFYYAGYAHEGAAWLTLALGLATVILSFIFRGRLLRDPRLARLRKLAWIWSAENLVLAAAVYNRLYIYIGFNGMTRMRIIGMFGMTAVVVGFVLVLWKIANNHGFIWLLRRHLWTLALTVYLFALTPVDAIWVGYNVRRVLSGDPAPSVQISYHSIDSEGILLLPPLVDCEDETIREGVLAMLAQRQAQTEAILRSRQEDGWTAIQIVDRVLLERLSQPNAPWQKYAEPQRRDATVQRFKDYAYDRWY